MCYMGGPQGGLGSAHQIGERRGQVDNFVISSRRRIHPRLRPAARCSKQMRRSSTDGNGRTAPWRSNATKKRARLSAMIMLRNINPCICAMKLRGSLEERRLSLLCLRFLPLFGPSSRALGSHVVHASPANNSMQKQVSFMESALKPSRPAPRSQFRTDFL